MIPEPEIKFRASMPRNDKFTIVLDYGDVYGMVNVVLNCIYFLSDGQLKFLSCFVSVCDRNGNQMASGEASDVYGMSEAFEKAMTDLALNKKQAISDNIYSNVYDKCEQMLWDASLMNLEKGIIEGRNGNVRFSLDAISRSYYD